MKGPEAANDPGVVALRPSKRASWLVTGLSLVLVGAAIAFADPAKVFAQLRGVNLGWLGLSFALSLLQTSVLGLRWTRIAALLGLEVRWWRATLECSLSIALNALLPGAALGDGLRALRHAHGGRRGFGSSLEAVAIDRVSGQLGLLLIVGLGLPWTWKVLVAGHATALSARTVGVSLAVLLLVCAGLVFASRSVVGRRVQAMLLRAGRMLFTAKAAAHHLPLSMGLVLMLVLQFDLAARALGVSLPLAQLLGLVPLVLLASSLPSSFGGWGLREVVSGALFAGSGVGGSTGVAVCVVFGAFAVIVAAPGLLVLLLPVHDEQKALTNGAPSRSALEVWGLLHAALMLGCLPLVFFEWGVRAFGVCALLSLAALVRAGRSRWTPHGGFGVANAVTALRGLLVVALPFLALDLSGPALAGCAVSVLALDVLDGYLARRLGVASDFGSSFDVETDALFVMVLSLLLCERGAAGPWVILAGAWRYLYVLAPLIVKTEEPQQRRSVLGRLAFVLMVASFVLGFLLPPELSQPVVALGVVAVSASFAYSFWLRYGARAD